MSGVAASITLWDTWELANFVRDDRAAPPDGFWLQFFPTPFFSEKKKIVFEELPIRDRRMAPFVMPNAQARVMRAPGPVGLRELEVAYVKPSHILEPDQAIPRQPGEPLGGTLSLQEKIDRLTGARILLQADMVKRRWDWMAAQAAIYGQVLVQGEDYAPVTVNFGRNGALTMLLTGTAQWGQADATPFQNILTMRERAYEYGESSIDNVILGTQAAKDLVADPTFKELMNTQYLPQIYAAGAGYQFQPRADMNTLGLFNGSPVEQIGRFTMPNGGQVNFWRYKNSYEDPYSGSTVDLLGANEVVGIGSAMGGVRAFGAIHNFRAGLQATDMFQMQWEDVNPSRLQVSTESAPLMIPTNPNNTFRIRTRV